VAGYCESDSEPSVSIKGEGFFLVIARVFFVKNDITPWR
jgi:hypothetical protein